MRPTGKGDPLLTLVILILTAYWLLSFFDTPILPGLTHTGYFSDILSVIIVVLIFINVESIGTHI
jgi:hypothetical protein